MVAEITARTVARVAARKTNDAIGGGAAAVPLLLDTYTGASSAYSLRKLRTAYSGSAIRVRRSSDNAEQDIGFVSGVLDTASLATFCGAGSGYITTFYDQAGSVNYTQATTTAQPRIVNAGTVESLNSKTAINALGAQWLLSSFAHTGSGLTAIAVASMDSGTVNYGRMLTVASTVAGEDYQSVGAAALVIRNGSTNAIQAYRNGGGQSSSAVTLATQFLGVSKFDGTNHTMRVNAANATAMSSTGNFSAVESTLLVGSARNNFWTGKLQELILIKSAISSPDLSTVETDINAYYGVY